MASYRATLKRIMDGGFDDADEAERSEAVRDVINACSIAGAAVAIQPIPLVDVALLSPIQIAMVQGIARIYGHSLDKKAVIEILSTFGASLVAQSAIMAAAKLVPFLGWAISASMAYALTYAVGEVSDHYFKNGRGVSSDELKSMFNRVYEQKKAEKQAANKSNATLKDKLEQLNDAYKNELLTEEEYAAKKEKLLEDF
jgi:uncharacterized protein (DUF697 family)